MRVTWASASRKRSRSLSASIAECSSASVKWRSGTAGDNRRVASPGTGVKLTSLSHGAGCACKLSPADLRPLIADLPRGSDPKPLVGHEAADGAAAYRVGRGLAIGTA